MTAAANGNGYSRTNFYISVIGSALAALAVIVSLIFWISGVAQGGQTNTKTSEGLDGRLSRLEDIVGANGIKITTLQRNQNEIETQFCANDIVRNLMHANDLREVSLLWQKVYGTVFPISNAYYPTICNRAVPQ